MEETQKFYETSPWSESLVKKENESHFVLQSQARCRFIAPFVSEAVNVVNVLDFGSGAGAMGDIVPSAVRKTVVYDVVEINPEAVKLLKGRSSVASVFQTIDAVSGRYDLAIASHVLEHMFEPEILLRSLRDRLSPGGILFVEVPNEDWRFKTTNEPHVVFFSQPMLVHLLNRAGFTVLRAATCGRRVLDLIMARRISLNGRIARSVCLVYFALQKLMRIYEEDEGYARYGGDRRWIRVVCRRTD